MTTDSSSKPTPPMDSCSGQTGDSLSSSHFYLGTESGEETGFPSSRGDYLGLAVEGGRVAFAFNLGKETSVRLVRTRPFVADGRWHALTFQRSVQSSLATGGKGKTRRGRRSKRQGWLSVDGDEPVGFLSAQGATELNSDGHLWIGGRSDLPGGLPPSFYRSFVGCVRRVVLAGQPLHLVHHSAMPGPQLPHCH